MGRDRFRCILSMLHLNNNENFIVSVNPGYDPIFKIRPFFDHFINASTSLFVPNQNLCLDEIMCPFRGHIRFRVYMKDKPEKYGIKLYAVTDAETGYVLNAEIYTGKSDHKQ